MNKIARLLVGINRIPSDSALYGWGRDSTGSLAGLGSVSTPAALSTYDPIGIQYESWSQIATGRDFTLAIRSDGTLWSWGTNTYGQLGNGTTVSNNTPTRISTNVWNNVSAGVDFAAAVRSDGKLFTWGKNTNGVIGDGTVISRSSPTQVGTNSWSQVSAGQDHVAAIRSDGTVWCWGYGLNGELGDNTGVSRSSPVQVGNNAASPTANVINTTGYLTEYGTTDLTPNTTPIGNTSSGYWTLSLPFNVTFTGEQYSAITILTGSAILFGNSSASLDGIDLGRDVFGTPHSCQRIWYGTTGSAGSRRFIVRYEGTADSSTGTLGSPTLLWEASLYEANPKRVDVWRSTPYNYSVKVYTSKYKPLANSTMIATGSFGGIPGMTYVISTTGGNDVLTTPQSWSQVSAGNGFTFGIRSDNNQLYGWGGSTQYRTVPVYWREDTSVNPYAPLSPVQIGAVVWTTDPGQTQYPESLYFYHTTFNDVGSLPSSWSQISAGGLHAVGLDSTGRLWSWGRNSSGECGYSNSSTSPIAYAPAQVGNTAWTKAVAGISSTIAINDSDGSLWAWGNNQNYQVGYVSGNTSWTQISSLGTYTDTPVTYGITADGALKTWGSIPAASMTGSWAVISAGKSHVGGIKADGTLWMWGQNGSGQLGDGTTGPKTTPVQINGSWTTVAAGTSHTVAIKTDSTMWAWGGSWPGTTTPVQIAGSWTAVSAGNNTTVATKTDGTLHTIGQNYYGQLGYDSTRTSYASWTTMAGSIDGSHGVIHAIKPDGTLWTWGHGATQVSYSNGFNASLYGATQFGLGYGLGTSSTRTETYTFANNAYATLYLYEVKTPTQISGSWTQVSSGREHAVGIQTNYKLYGWGKNSYNQLGNTSISYANTPILIDQTYSWTQVAAGVKYNIALNSEGKVFGWGSPDAGALLTVANLPTTWSKVAQGRNHMLAIANNGYLYSWGNNSEYQRGYGNTGVIAIPVLVSSSSWTSVAAGSNTSFAIRADGTLWGWGKNSYYATYATTPSYSSPVQIGTSNNWTTISARGTYVFGLRDGANGVFRATALSTSEIGTVSNTQNYSWIQVAAAGNGNSSVDAYFIRQDGALYAEGQYVPKYTDNASWKQIDAGTIYSVVVPTYPFTRTNDSVAAVRNDGTLWVWGYSGDISNSRYGAVYYYRSSPSQIGTANTWTKVSRDPVNDITYAVKNDGTLWDVSTYKNNAVQSSPVQVGSSNNWSDVSTNWGTTLALTTSGSLYAMGALYVGLPGSNGYTTTPTKVDDNSWIQISAGQNYNMAIRSDGTLWTWGFTKASIGSDYGRLGVTTTRASLAPISWSQIAVSEYTAAALTSDGKLYTWGRNDYGQIGKNNVRSQVGYPRLVNDDVWTHIAVTDYSVHAIKSNGTLWTWGRNNVGQLGLGDIADRSSPVQVGAATDWSYISAYGYYGTVLGIRGTTLYGWGDGSAVGDGAQVNRSSPVQIGTGYSIAQVGSSESGTFSLAIKTDGTLWTWGNNYYGQLGLGDRISRSLPTQVGSLTGWTNLSAGYGHVVALRGPREMYVWGRNDYSQLGLGPLPQTSQSRSSPVQIGAASLLSLSNTSLSISSILASRYKTHITFNNGELWYTGTQYTAMAMPPGDGSNGYSSGYSISWFQVASSGISKLPKSSDAKTGYYIKTDGTLFTWGLYPYASSGGYLFNYNDAPTSLLTDTTTTTTPVQILTTGVQDYLNEPVQVGTSNTWSYVSAGLENVAGINGGKLYMWGRNTDGQLGLGDTVHRSAPTQVGNTNWGTVKTKTGISSTMILSTQTVGITSDNRIFEWGFFDYVSGAKQRRSSPVQLGTGANSSILAVVNYGDIEQYPGSITSTSNSLSRMIINRWTHLGYGVKAAGNTEILSDYVDDPILQSGRNVVYKYGELAHPGSWTKVSASNNHALAIKADGTLWSWGMNDFGQLGTNAVTLSGRQIFSPAQIGTGNTWIDISAGSYYSMARKSDGTIWGWGRQAYGQLGIGSSVNYSSPVQIGVANNWASIVTQQDANFTSDVTFASYALASNGDLYAAGSGYFGDNTSNTSFQTNTTFTYVTPVSTSVVEGPQVLLAGSWNQISSGLSHNMAIRSDGTLWGWGSNEYGQIGDNSSVTRSSPVQIGTQSWTWISTGPRHTAGITNNQLYVWGDNSSYQVGDTTSTHRSSPVQVSGSWAKGVAGDGFTVAIENTTNDLYGWGNVPYTGSRSSPVQIDSGNWTNIWVASTIAPGSQTEFKYPGFYALANTGVLYMQGQGPVGHTFTTIVSRDTAVALTIADGNARTSTSAFAQVGSSSWTLVSAAAEQMAAISGNTIFTWGLNTYGQLGDVTTEMRSSPVQISADWSKIAMGEYSMAAIKTNGTMWTWGRNTNGELGNSDTNKAHTSSPVQVGTANNWTYVMRTTRVGGALTSNGALYMWGANGGYLAANSTAGSLSPTLVPTYQVSGTSSPVQISTGSWDTVDIRWANTAIGIKQV